MSKKNERLGLKIEKELKEKFLNKIKKEKKYDYYAEFLRECIENYVKKNK